MSERATLPAGTSVALRERFARLPPDDQSRLLARLGERRQQRLRRFKVIRLSGGSLEAHQTRPPIVAMPSLFGGSGEWRDFASEAGFAWPVYGLELMGTGSYWKPEPTLVEIAAACVDALRRDGPSGRIHLAGHSFGARLAYEVGQQLDAAGRAPISVVLLDTTAGWTPRRLRWRDLRSMAANLPVWLRNELSYYAISGIAGRIGWRRHFRERVTDNPVGRMFDLSGFSVDLRRRVEDGHLAFRSYQTKPTRNRVSYLRCRVQSLVHADWPDGGWGAFVPEARLTVSTIPGDHGSALQPRWTDQVHLAIARVLDQAERDPG